jgi:hypothetical protein
VGDEFNQLQVIFDPFPGFLEDASEHTGQRQNGWPHIEAKAVGAMFGCFSPKPFVLFEKRHVVSASRQNARRREAAKSAADNCDSLGMSH